MPGTKTPHSLSLDGRHTEQVLGVGQVGRQLRQLGMKMGLFSTSAQVDSRERERKQRIHQLTSLDGPSRARALRRHGRPRHGPGSEIGAPRGHDALLCFPFYILRRYSRCLLTKGRLPIAQTHKRSPE